MKTFLRYALLGLLAIGLFFLLGWWLRDPAPERISGMPWQVSEDSAGRRTVFGLTLGRTTLAEARKHLTRAPELALFVHEDDAAIPARLEAFFDLVPLGTMISRVVLTLDTGGVDVDAIRHRASSREPASTGEWRYAPHPDDVPAIEALPLAAITYVPIYVRLDDDMLISRFGQPAEIVDEGEGRRRWRYPTIGLEVLTDKRGKSVFEYR